MENSESSAVVDNVFGNYTLPENGFDEMFERDRQPRAHWQYLAGALNALGSAELSRRSQEAQQLLRDNGVTYSAVGEIDAQDRPWELDPIPLLLASEDWRTIERGLMQRAELLRCLLCDLYGPQETLQKGLLPPEVIYAHPGFLRPCYDLPAFEGNHALPLYAADLVRAPNGVVYVIGDRSQAPPGVGYALENRIILTRVLPSLFRDSQVHRLVMYFRSLRNTLAELAWRDQENARIVVLSPGPISETYFEHAYLAKYLGYTLVQGADLTVRDTRVWLKTLDGLQPVDVILRFVDDACSDPLELRPDSVQGIPGLLQAIRCKRIALANPPGCGILENSALKSFLPGLAKYFLGESLLLESPPTYWCGDSKQREHVLANLDQLVVKSSVCVPSEATHYGRLLDDHQRSALRDQILANPYLYVGQEETPPATLPVFNDGVSEPRQMILRSFLVASKDDYVVMPGGLTRVAKDPEVPVEPVKSGGVSKDTWVLATEPTQQLTLVRDEPLYALIGGHGELPSRVAENLFWLGRYAERSESIIRLLRIVFLHLLETEEGTLSDSRQACLHSLLRTVTYLTETHPGFLGPEAEPLLTEPGEELLSVFLDPSRQGSLAFNLGALLNAARSVRDRISPDIWRVFNEIDTGLRRLRKQRETRPSFNGSRYEVLNTALDSLNELLTAFAAFTGLAMDSMIHGQGWTFLMLGRRLERAQQTAPLLRATVAAAIADESPLLERVLQICDSMMTYRSRYRTQARAQAMLDLLLQDESNPRALCYQLKHLHDDIRALPRQDKALGYKKPEQRLALEALSRVRLADTAELAAIIDGERPELDRLLAKLSELLPQLSNALTHSYFSHAERPQQLIRFGAEARR